MLHRAAGSGQDVTTWEFVVPPGEYYEGGIRVPFVASWPGTLPSHAEYHHPVNSIDVACTALSLASIDPIKNGLDGVALVPHLSGKTDKQPHDAIFWRKENGQSWAVRSGSLKLLKTAGDNVPELYDLEKDIGETMDLTDSRPQDVSRLAAMYERWNLNNKPPFFVGYREYHRLMEGKYRELEKETVQQSP